MIGWYVRIVETEPNQTEDEIGKGKNLSIREALLVEKGINATLNKEKYHTELIQG